MKRRDFLALSITAVSGLLAGCEHFGPVTDAWLEDSKYEETLTAFLISKDGKKLVVIGKRYHYVFDLPPQLHKVMTASYRPKLRTSFDAFEAQGDKISGRYTMMLPHADAPRDSETRAHALEDGFADDGYDISESGTISGKRYMPSSIDGAAIPQAFNSEYRVNVTEKPTPVGKAIKLALSPVTMAADGGLLLAGIALFPIGFALFIAMLKAS